MLCSFSDVLALGCAFNRCSSLFVAWAKFLGSHLTEDLDWRPGLQAQSWVLWESWDICCKWGGWIIREYGNCCKRRYQKEGCDVLRGWVWCEVRSQDSSLMSTRSICAWLALGEELERELQSVQQGSVSVAILWTSLIYIRFVFCILGKVKRPRKHVSSAKHATVCPESQSHFVM